MDALWEQGKVPAWVDIGVVDQVGGFTVLQVHACHERIEDPTGLYYSETEHPPFGVKGPELPPDHQRGEPFSLHWSFRLDRIEDLPRIAAHAEHVRSLDVDDPAFDDEGLSALPQLPALRRLCLRDAAVSGPGLVHIDRYPHLETLLVDGRPGPLDLSVLPLLPALRYLGLRRRAQPRGLSRLLHATPGLESLHLGCDGSLDLDEPIPSLPGLTQLSLESTSLTRVPGLSGATLEQAGLCVETITDADVVTLLGGQSRLQRLRIISHAVTDALFEHLPRWPGLSRLRIHGDGNVSEAGVEHARQQHPGLDVRVQVAPR